jgi:hypothetical protein
MKKNMIWGLLLLHSLLNGGYEPIEGKDVDKAGGKLTEIGSFQGVGTGFLEYYDDLKKGYAAGDKEHFLAEAVTIHGGKLWYASKAKNGDELYKDAKHLAVGLKASCVLSYITYYCVVPVSK